MSTEIKEVIEGTANTLDVASESISFIKQILSEVKPILMDTIDSSWPTVKSVIQLDALSTIVGLVFVITVCLVFFRWIFKMHSDLHVYKKLPYDPRNTSDEYVAPVLNNDDAFIGSVLASIVVGVVFLFTAYWILNVWLWVKLFNPELWLVYTAVTKVTGS